VAAHTLKTAESAGAAAIRLRALGSGMSQPRAAFGCAPTTSAFRLPSIRASATSWCAAGSMPPPRWWRALEL